MMQNKLFLAAFSVFLILLLLAAAAVLIPLGLYLTAQPCTAVRILGYLFLITGGFSMLQLSR